MVLKQVQVCHKLGDIVVEKLLRQRVIMLLVMYLWVDQRQRPLMQLSYICALVLFDLSCTFSYVSAYTASSFNMMYDSLFVPLCVVTSIGDSFVVYWVYQSYVLTLSSYNTWLRLNYSLYDRF